MSDDHKKAAIAFMHALGKGDIDTIKALASDQLEAIAMGSSCLSGPRRLDDVIAGVSIFPQITKNGLRFEVISATAEEDRVSLELNGFSELINGEHYNNQYHMLFFFEGDKIIKMKEYCVLP